MQNIKVARETYHEVRGEELIPRVNCYIEPADRSWIIWCNEDGRPFLYNGERDENGGVLDEGIRL